MRLMMVEYTYTPAPPDKGPIVHGVCNRRRLEHIIQDGSITAKMIEDEYAAALQRKWEGDIEPAPKKKSPPDQQVPANTAFVGNPAFLGQPPADFSRNQPMHPALASAAKPISSLPAASKMAPSMPPSGIGKK